VHELSIALRILDLAVEELARCGAARAVAVHVKVGRLSGIVSAALRRAFELAREGTVLGAAELVVEDVPVAAYCGRCEAERVVEFPLLRCPACGWPTPEVVRGRELELIALEIESPCPEPPA
jgi:hydrogenase nickel incorporation protein HypA/HybF